MADFAVFVTAAETALGWRAGDFMAAYTSNQREAVAMAIDADVVAKTVVRFMRERDVWSGEPAELHQALEELASERDRTQRGWPKAPNALSNRLRRLAPVLRESGIDIARGHDGRDDSKRRVVTLRRSPRNIVPTVPGAPDGETTQEGGGAAIGPAASPGSSPGDRARIRGRSRGRSIPRHRPRRPSRVCPWGTLGTVGTTISSPPEVRRGRRHGTAPAGPVLRALALPARAGRPRRGAARASWSSGTNRRSLTMGRAEADRLEAQGHALLAQGHELLARAAPSSAPRSRRRTPRATTSSRLPRCPSTHARACGSNARAGCPSRSSDGASSRAGAPSRRSSETRRAFPDPGAPRRDPRESARELYVELVAGRPSPVRLKASGASKG